MTALSNSEIRALRLRRGMTQVQFAEALDVDQSTVSRWERGIEAPRPAAAGAIWRLILDAPESATFARAKAILGDQRRPAALIDPAGRFVSQTQAGRAYFVQKYGFDPSDVMGRHWLSFYDRIGLGEFIAPLTQAELLTPDALVANIVSSTGHERTIMQTEAMFDGGVYVGMLAWQIARIPSPEKLPTAIERIDIVRPGASEKPRASRDQPRSGRSTPRDCVAASEAGPPTRFAS